MVIYSRSVEQSHEQFYYAYMDCKSKRQHVTRLLKTLLYMLFLLFLIMIQLDSSLLCFLFFKANDFYLHDHFISLHATGAALMDSGFVY